MKLLLISNSTNPGEAYLEYPKNDILTFLGVIPVKCVFIPYAAVTFTYDQYEAKVAERFRDIGHDIISIHRYSNPESAILEAQAIVIGGGNTWKLLKTMRENRLLEPIRRKILTGMPYIGWSAGSNVACPTIKTTNDMPVVEPDSFTGLNLVPFQINPHYLDSNPEGHAGETREQRIEEFIELNPGIWVVGLREGTMLVRDQGTLTLKGQRNARIFRKGVAPLELTPEDDFSFLMK